jgi:hypothetical protein
MNRKHVHNLSAYLDGEDTPPQRAATEQHLQECSSCYKKYQLLLEIRRQAQRLRSFPVRPTFTSQVMSRLNDVRKESLWNVIDLIPRPLVNGLFIVSLILIAIVAIPFDSASKMQQQPMISELYPLPESEMLQTLDTRDEALQFALNNNEEFSGVFNGN